MRTSNVELSTPDNFLIYLLLLWWHSNLTSFYMRTFPFDTVDKKHETILRRILGWETFIGLSPVHHMFYLLD
jgi:hypothetical protein